MRPDDWGDHLVLGNQLSALGYPSTSGPAKQLLSQSHRTTFSQLKQRNYWRDSLSFPIYLLTDQLWFWTFIPAVGALPFRTSAGPFHLPFPLTSRHFTQWFGGCLLLLLPNNNMQVWDMAWDHLKDFLCTCNTNNYDYYSWCLIGVLTN